MRWRLHEGGGLTVQLLDDQPEDGFAGPGHAAKWAEAHGYLSRNGSVWPELGDTLFVIRDDGGLPKRYGTEPRTFADKAPD